MEVDGHADTSPAQSNEIGQEYWHSMLFQPEEIPYASDGLEFGTNQIKYCLFQKMRMNSWNKTVDRYNYKFITAFNSKVFVFNIRYSHCKYRVEALEHAQGEVAQLAVLLEANGNFHKGPRSESPSKLPTGKKLSPRTVTFGGVRPHVQCSGSSELRKCQALAAKIDAEPEQRKACRTRLEADQARAIAEVAK